MSQSSRPVFECGDADALVSYLYDDLSPADRRAMDAHLASCAACAGEVEGLYATRGVLAAWAPPDAELGFRIVQDPPAKVVSIAASRRWAWTAAPGWLPAAAAVLMVASAAAIAHVQVRYDDRGLTVSTGWGQPAPMPAAAPTPAVNAVNATATTFDQAPWRRDLEALEAQIHREIVARPAVTAGASTVAQADLLERVRALLEQSEQRQQRELALRLAQVVRDVDSQRRADLVRIERSMVQTQGMAGVEVAQQRQLLNYLVKVSQQR